MKKLDAEMQKMEVRFKRWIDLIKGYLGTAVWLVKLNNCNDCTAYVGNNVLIVEVNLWSPECFGQDCSANAFDFNRSRWMKEAKFFQRLKSLIDAVCLGNIAVESGEVQLSAKVLKAIANWDGFQRRRFMSPETASQLILVSP